MTAEIETLTWRPRPRIRFEALELLHQTLGYKAGNEVIERVVYEVSERMCKLQQALYDGDLDRVAAIAARLDAISRQIGLLDFADVARDLQGCIARSDVTASFAVATRLIRLGESSMFQAVQFADMTGG